MVFVDWAWLHMSIQPAVDGLEGDAELLGKLGLAQFVFEAVGIELVNEVLGHGMNTL